MHFWSMEISLYPDRKMDGGLDPHSSSVEDSIPSLNSKKVHHQSRRIARFREGIGLMCSVCKVGVQTSGIPRRPDWQLLTVG